MTLSSSAVSHSAIKESVRFYKNIFYEALKEINTHEIRGDNEGLSTQIAYCVNTTESGAVRF